MFTILVLIPIAVAVAWAYNKITTASCKSSRHLVGKTVIITGGNTGIGYETAKDMADRGARVILACRVESRGTTARDKIIQETDNRDVHYRHLDLASLASVRAFADNILSTEQRLDILINNAGTMETPFEITDDGLVREMQTNHFGPFLLTNLLFPLLKSSAPSRIVNVSSLAHHYGKIELDNLNMGKERNNPPFFLVYSNSKLANVLITVELAQRLKSTGVTAYSLHPGLIATEILHPMPWMKTLMIPIRSLFIKTPWEGAQTTIYCAVASELANTSGRYYSDCKEVKASKRGAVRIYIWLASYGKNRKYLSN